MTLYLMTNIVTGKQYVGATTQSLAKRLGEHRARSHRNYPLYLAARTHGWDTFTVETIGTAETVEQLMQMEMDAIRKLGTRFPAGYNYTDGGKGTKGRLHSELTLSLLRERAKTNRGGWNRGLKTGPLSAETRAKLSEAHKGQKAWNKGIPHTLRTRLQMSFQRMGAGNVNAKRVECNGIIYPSGADAMEALGLSRMQLQYRIRKGEMRYLAREE